MTRARDLAAFVSNADGDIKFDTDTLFIDSSTNRVGIGTTTPDTSLHIETTAPILSLVDSNSFTDANDRAQIRASSDKMNFQWYDDSASTTTEIMAITDDGNVGIGSTSPDTPLYVDCGAPSGADKTIATFQSQTSRQIGFVWDDSASTMGIATLTNHPIAFHINGNSSETMRVTSDGLTFNGDTAAANALDDYEEGVYNFTITGETSGSATIRSGYDSLAYTKIGRLVTVTGRWEVSGGHNIVGNVKFSLPFAINGSLDDQAEVGVGVITVLRSGTDFDQGTVFGAVGFSGDSSFVIYYQPSGTGNEAIMTGSQLDSNFEGHVQFQYVV